MSDSLMFHAGNRRLQDQFDSRRIADRLEEKLTRQAFSDGDRSFTLTVTARDVAGNETVATRSYTVIPAVN